MTAAALCPAVLLRLDSQANFRLPEKYAMLKKWLDSVFSKRKPHNKNTGERYPYPLDIEGTAAEAVLNRLHRAGYQAYLVGGAVRDLLLGMEPKDFDVATDATPEEVRKIFRRSRIIGRRFQIVHVMVGAETIEVSTFRSGGKVRRNEHGRIMNDNAYGTLEQDALRRDFTCNALYYDCERGEIIDRCGGLADIRARRLVMIGNAAERYQEDPVRILRAVRLSGKLGFEVDAATAAPIAEAAVLLQREPVARLFDELLKILFSGHAAGCLVQLKQLGVSADIHPILTAMLDSSGQPESHIAADALRQTDRRLGEGKTVSVGFVLAAVLWPELEWRLKQNAAAHKSAAAAMNAAISDVRDSIEKGWGVPQRFAATMREIWALQPQFAYCRGSRPFRLLAQPRFRAAYDFLLLRAAHDDSLRPLAEWWTRFQHAGEDERNEMVQNAPADAPPAGKRRRRKPRKKKPSGSSAE